MAVANRSDLDRIQGAAADSDATDDLAALIDSEPDLDAMATDAKLAEQPTDAAADSTPDVIAPGDTALAVDDDAPDDSAGAVDASGAKDTVFPGDSAAPVDTAIGPKSCASDMACASSGQACDIVAGVCVDCLDNSDCANGFACVAKTCQMAPPECTPVGKPCDDTDPCTVGDQCQGGVCKGAAAKNCNDANVCTSDACDANGCSHNPLAEGTGCGSAGCTISVCKGGLCIAGAEKLWNKAMPNFRVADIVPLPTGYLLALPGNGTPGEVVRTDLQGNVVWKTGAHPFAVAVTPQGYVATGYSPQLHTALVHLDWDGKLLSEKAYIQPDEITSSGNALVVLPDGVALSGTATFSTNGFNYSKAFISRFDTKGVLLWSAVYTSDVAGPSSTRGDALVALADGFALAGTYGSKMPSQGWLVRTDGQGKLLWQKSYPVDKVFQHLSGMVAVAGGFVLGGAVYKNQAYIGCLVRTDAQGNVLWQRTYPILGGFQRMIALPDGFAIAGAPTFGFSVLRTDVLGNVIWQRKYSVGNAAYETGYPFAGAALADGLLVGGAVGGFVGSQQPHAFLLRLDAWGNDSCAAAGSCAGKSSGDCDDMNPCTADLCDALTACSHVAFPDGSACGGGLTCGKGVCVKP